MLDQYSSQSKPNKTNLILVEPSYKLSHQFAQLRNQLDQNDIKYMSLIGYDEVKQLMKDKTNRNLIVINSSNMMRNQFPKQIFNVYGNQIYFYPNRYENYGFLPNMNNVVDLYRTATGTGTISRGINLRSIKKDIQRSRQKKQYTQFYDKIMVMHPKGYNPQYEQLFNILQGFKNKVQPISRQNQAHYHKQGKALLVLEREAFDSVNKFIIDNRQENNIDLAILGYIRGFADKKNYAIMTDHPAEIIQYLDQAGLSLPGAKQKLAIGRSLQKSSSLNKQQTAMFVNADHNQQPSFSQQKNQYTHPIKVYEDNNMIDSNHHNYQNNGDYQVSYEKPSDPNQIPINSKLSQKSNKKPKKIKKLGGLTNSVAGSSVRSSDEVPPVINIHTVNSEQSSQQKILLKDQIKFDDRDSQKIINGHPIQSVIPLNNMPPLPPQNSVGAQSQNGQFVLNKADTNRKQKPVMHWNLYPDKNRKSQFLNGPLFVLNQLNQNTPLGSKQAISLKLVQSQKSINPNFSAPPVPTVAPVPEIVTYNNNQQNSRKSIPGSMPPRPPTIRSRQSISQQSDFSSRSIRDLDQQQKRLKIQQKYNKGNQIRELSEEYRGSNLSFPIDDGSQRIGINSNSNNSRDMMRQQSPVSPTDYYYSQFRPKNGQLGKQLQVKRSTSLQDKGDPTTQLNQAIIRNSEVVTTSKKIPISQQLQRAQYQIKYANNTNTITSNQVPQIQAQQTTTTNNNNATIGRVIQPRVIKHSIQMPQTYYQDETRKSIPTQKDIYNTVATTQPTITSETVKYATTINNNQNGVSTSVYKPTSTRLYNSPVSDPAYTSINNKINQTLGSGKSVSTAVVDNPAYSAINSRINEAISNGAPVTSNPVYSPINKVVSNYLSNTNPGPASTSIPIQSSGYNSNAYTSTSSNPTADPKYQLINRSINAAISANAPVTSNPAYAVINSTINSKLGNPTSTSTNTNVISSAPIGSSSYSYDASSNGITRYRPGYDYYSQTSATSTTPLPSSSTTTPLSKPKQITTTNTYTSTTLINANTNTNPITNTTNNSVSRPSLYNTTTTNNNAQGSSSIGGQINMKNYMQNLGINEDKYDIIEGSDGTKTYRLKTSYTSQQNNQILDRYKSAPKPETSGLGSPRANLFNWDEYDQHIDQRGRKYYTLKKLTSNTITPATATANPIATPNKVQTPNSTHTQQTPNSQQLLIQSKSASRIDYNRDNPGNQYNSYNSPVAVHTATESRNSVSNNMVSRNKEETSVRYSSNNVISPTSNTYTSPNNNINLGSGTNVYNPYAYSPTHVNTHTNQEVVTYDHKYQSPTSANSYYNTASIRPSSSNIISHQESKSHTGRVKVMEDHHQGITSAGKLYQVNKRYSVSPQTVTRELKSREQGPNSLKEVYQMESRTEVGGAGYNSNTYNRVEQSKYEYAETRSKSSRPSIDTRLSTQPMPAIHATSNTATKKSQFYNQSDDTSQLSRESLMTDSRPSMSKIFNAHLYGENKPYLTSGNMKIDSSGDLSRIYQDLKNLKTSNNFTHFIIDTTHPMRSQIGDYAGVQDKIVEIDFPEKVNEYMLKKPLPNQFYDVGFIFLNKNNQGQVSPSSIIDGYYLVDISKSNPSIEVKKQKKTILMNSLDNIEIAKKLLLAPCIQHYIFYPKGSDSEISKLLNLFPSNKFQKNSYGNRSELQNMLNMYLKNKGRLMRVLIFVNPTNIKQIEPVLDSNLNHKTFTMICNSQNSIDDRLRDQYKRVKFSSNFDFNSYGSVMNMSSLDSNAYAPTPEPHFDLPPSNNYIPNNYSEKYDMRNQEPMIFSNNEGNRPKIYVQHPHTGIDKQIQRSFPGAYEIKFFNNASEIKEKSRDNFILLHREADNVGTQFDRNLGTLILLGGKKGDRIPSGSVNIPTMSELVKNIL